MSKFSCSQCGPDDNAYGPVCARCVDDYLAGLRRRRDAALRLPQLVDGVRDPWLRAAA